MLRYYEQIGLVQSQRTDEYAYRVYDEANVARLRQIIMLRKLRVPVKQIREIFANNDAACVIEIFERNISQLDEEITALSTVKAILVRLAKDLREKANMQLDLLGDSGVFAIVDSVNLPNNIIQEEPTMSELNKAGETLTKIHDVKYVELAPARAIAFDAVSKNPEDDAMEPIFKWVKDNKLEGTARYYLYNINPYEHETSDGTYGMGCCATIPEGVVIPTGFYERQLPGGTYVLSEWKDDHTGWKTIQALMDDPAWEWEYEGRNDCRGLEEHIERAGGRKDGGFIINIMLPVKKKAK